MMIPLRSELRLTYKPIVTYSVVVLCIIIYAFQANNHKKINRSINSYCYGVNNYKADFNELDFISHNQANCISWLTNYYRIANKEYVPYFFKRDYDAYLAAYSRKFDATTYYATLKLFQDHIESLSLYAPVNLDGILVYDPSTLNPLTMVTSVLSHGSFLHLFFNLVFFLAFAPALEALVGGRWQFLGVIGLMILGTNLTYALVMGMEDYPTPTLGLSGIVSGMIGFAASFMPRARVRTFYYVMVIPTPVWLLAAYYIGWDAYDLFTRTDHGGVNIVVHVAGGVIGILMMLLFRKRHKEISDELHDEIEYMRNQRTTLVDSVSSKSEIASKENQEANKKKDVEFMETLHRLVRVDNHSNVINLILSEYDPDHLVIERYEYLFGEIGKWKTGRSYECIGRLIINYRMQQGQIGVAIRYAKILYQAKNTILLADPTHILKLTEAAKDINDFELALALVENAAERYSDECGNEEYLLNEIELLHLHLNKTQQALKVLKKIFDDRTHPHRDTLIQYARKIGLIGPI